MCICLSVHQFKYDFLSGILSPLINSELVLSPVEMTRSLGILQVPRIFTLSLLLRHGKKTAPEICFPPPSPGGVVIEGILCLKLEAWEEREGKDKTLITNMVSYRTGRRMR